MNKYQSPSGAVVVIQSDKAEIKNDKGVFKLIKDTEASNKASITVAPAATSVKAAISVPSPTSEGKPAK